MELLELFSLLLTCAAVFSFINAKWLKLPTTIGLMVVALLFSLGLIGAGKYYPGLLDHAERLVAEINFTETLMEGMLGFLLFAGALHINLEDLKREKWPIAILATLGVVLSTLFVAGLSWAVFWGLGIGIPPIYCLLFGALISPTDPIAVLSILKSVGAPKELETKIAGESLFNDGVGVVIFLGIWEIASGEHGFDPQHLAVLFLQEAVGGVLFGLLIGYVGYLMLRSLDNYSVEILISLAMVAGGYSLAHHLHISGPIAMVCAGLLIGNHGRSFAMSENTVKNLDRFWELIDEILNSVLFVLIGLEVLILEFNARHLMAAALLVPAVLLARYAAIKLPLSRLDDWYKFHPKTVQILTWGGLRGGISVALALSIGRTTEEGHPVHERDLLIAVTYVIVVFSIIVQGLTIGPYTRWALNIKPPESDPESADS
ncbi:MAG: sodium:proton antiporter [Planctomycetaceae bacterium]